MHFLTCKERIKIQNQILKYKIHNNCLYSWKYSNQLGFLKNFNK